MRRGMLVAAALVVLGAGCNRAESPTITVPTGSPAASPSAAAATVAVSSPADNAEIGGNVVALAVEAKGIEVKAADGDRSGKTGHYHVFVDKDPVAPGQVIPMEAGVIHSATSPILVPGLSVGEHTLTVVMGNGVHERIAGEPQTVKVKVKGPSVKASAPATVKAGQPVVVTMSVEGVQIKAADGDTSGKTGHYHVFIDPATAPAADGQVIPKNDKIIHTDQSTATINGLAPGSHTIWVIVGDGKHIPLNPLVAAKLTVVVQQ
ncbi:MAG TPA: DUF4399 domain-containing protein [Actinomycetota bacterium]|jgi:hypothetical protein